ncbi:DUF1289 domain-containing protein [Oceanospirillum sanctuarii]|uniref:DUF1289 domain-containing protein n=1 Tax=Oceanospirillum sanctuarii TaxID=1434821 RepID=UPI000A38CF28|nr:DUF1289 domain-containing protein [Oceanospirillum sanctuarii]
MSQKVSQPQTANGSESTKPTPSPCVSICALNDEGFCIGCYRDGNEIRLWNTYNDDQKRQVLNSCQRRATLDQAFVAV